MPRVVFRPAAISDLKQFASDVTQTALLLFSPSPGGRVRALGRSRNAR